jgi:hypothetical protein
MSKKKWHTSPWTISLGSALFGFLLLVAYDAFRNKPILTSLSIIFGYLWNFLLAILNFPIKLWWLLSTVVIVILVISFIKKLFPQEQDPPPFYNYREGKPKRWRWTWEWKFDQSENAWAIADLVAHCPKCNSSLMSKCSIYGPSFSCPLCDFSATSEYECDEPHKIERIISDNVERMRQGKTIIG